MAVPKVLFTLLLTGSLLFPITNQLEPSENGLSWAQWGMNPQHTGMMPVAGQRPEKVFAEILIDRNINQEIRISGGAPAHYQTPLVDGLDVFLEFKAGRYTGPQNWNTQSWGEMRYQWNGERLVKKWSFPSDWKPVPHGSPGLEPVFHAVLAGDSLYVPGFGGTVHKIDRETGKSLQRINPFGSQIRENIFVAGPLSADDQNNIYYNAVQLNLVDPWISDVVNSWLVMIRSDGGLSKVTFESLTPGAVGADDQCEFGFTMVNPNDVAPTRPCGTQRPGINVAPAIARDGTIYTISRSHFSDRYGYLIATNPDLKPKWIASLRGHLRDGCGVKVPMDGSLGACVPGARIGVDPSTNELPAGRIFDSSTSSPVVAPDGSILYGAYTAYNCSQGHLFKFSSKGKFLASYGFGWDITPAIYTHGKTYSVILKENQYGGYSWCKHAFNLTQVDRNLKTEWKLQNKNPFTCKRRNGKVECVKDQPNGFEWCVNAVAVDKDGNVFANSEDGNFYLVGQGGVVRKRLFLDQALGAAYTPMTLGPDGKIYAQNAGRLFVLGNKQRE